MLIFSVAPPRPPPPQSPSPSPSPSPSREAARGNRRIQRALASFARLRRRDWPICSGARCLRDRRFSGRKISAAIPVAAANGTDKRERLSCGEAGFCFESPTDTRMGGTFEGLSRVLVSCCLSYRPSDAVSPLRRGRPPFTRPI